MWEGLDRAVYFDNKFKCHIIDLFMAVDLECVAVNVENGEEGSCHALKDFLTSQVPDSPPRLAGNLNT